MIRLDGAGGSEVALDFPLTRETPVLATIGISSSSLVGLFFLAELSTFRVVEKDLGDAMFGWLA